MLEELRNFQVPTQPVGEFTHERVTISIEELATLLDSNLVLVPLTENDPLRVSNGFPDQFELVQVQDVKVTHYTLKTSSQTASVSVSDYIRQYVETGKIHMTTDAGDSDIHTVPLPTYPIVQYSNQFVPCVRLKNNKRALIVGNTIIEGVTYEG